VNDANKGADITIGKDTVNNGSITVTDTKQGTGKILVDGGTDVTITATSSAIDTAGTAGKITVGQGGAASDIPSGNVVIVNNLNSNGTAALTGGQIVVTGGKTVSVTVNATDVAKDTNANDGVTIGNVQVTGDGNTTSVSVKQTASVTQASKDAVGGVTETASVKFTAMTAGQTVILGGLTFTATTALTKEQAATAFANLAAGIVPGAAPTFAPLTAGDTQGSGVVANGVYTGALTGWTSGAATGDTVVFTFDTANTAAGGLALASTGTTIASGKTLTLTPTTGKAHDATPARRAGY